ncbi:cysteine sulfinic acid decarboxylase [Drosophila guanche]|uniref:Blast:Cysteine sulfinic acid decarboxylase n=2 Tax=Drosophila guanche TaxID=7266 RepID=A0A3B0K3M2_DROGU|nr:cysteine sulfinic acid decarboxylase [Drosophila guanche]SPP82540.1 blast:Cysteine sulfinic acid decarboxylase [Drosophila guanche]
MLASETFPAHHFKESIFKPYSANGSASVDDLASVNKTLTSAATTSSSDDTHAAIDIAPTASSVEFETARKMLTNNSCSNNNNNNNNETTDDISGFVASHPAAPFEGFIRACVDEIIKLAVFQGTNRSSKVVEWHEPAELRQLFDFQLRDKGESQDKLRELLRETIRFSVKTGHPYFINQLYSGVDPYALVGQWLTDALNPSVYTYEVAPLFTLMEEQVLAEMRRIVGFPNGGEGDGIFCPGGSIANGYAISCARYKHAPESKKNGLFNAKPLIIFTSEDAHYSVEKLAMFMGFGSDHVIKIATNEVGKMRLSNLEEQIQRCLDNGWQPLMVSATAGTTVLGAFDDLIGIGELCRKHNMWMHVDAAWGGGALMSKKYRHLLNGIEMADSVTWNPHKLLAASQQCSTFLTRHQLVLGQCHSTNAAYLFQKDKFYDTSFDTGDKHIQCGRRADVFKFWFMWKAKGSLGLEAHVEKVFRMAEFFTAKVRERAGFELVLESPECTNISFWYVPSSLRQMERNQEFYDKLHKVAPKVKEMMIKKGSMMITYQPLRQLPNFFRLVLQNSCLEESDMIYFLDEIESLAKSL